MTNQTNAIAQITRDDIKAATSEVHRKFLEIFYSTSIYGSRMLEALETFELLESDCNGTGYYDHLVKRDLGHPVGTVLRAMSPGENNRRILVVVTPVGNVVVFERYSAGARGVLVSNLPDELRGLVGSAPVSEDDFNRIVTSIRDTNIGFAVEQLVKRANKLMPIPKAM